MPAKPTAPIDVIAALDGRADRIHSAWDGGNMVWRCWGEGPPLVLLHGASGSWTHWIRNIPALSARFRVMVPDLPGFGESDTPPTPHSAEALADLLAAGLDTVLPPPAAFQVAGFSFGGIIGGLAAARPEARVRTLVLLGTGGMAVPRDPLPPLRRAPPGLSPEALAEVHRENLGTLMFGDPARVDDLAVHVQMENLRCARFRSGNIPDSDVLLRALPRVRARLAGIWGSRDPYAMPHLEARRSTLAAFQPELDFRVIEGAGHWSIYEAADAVNAALLEMLAEQA